MRIYTSLSFVLVFASPFLLPAQVGSTERELPRNLGGGLRELVQLHRLRPAGMLRMDLRKKTVAINSGTGRPTLVNSAQRGIVSDNNGRVLVTVILTGGEAVKSVRRTLEMLGGSVVAEDAAQPDTLSAFLPLGSAASFAASAGVSAVKLSRKPVHSVGAVTSQGAQIIGSDLVNAGGITGQGITLGIISDSFDGVTETPRALDDVASGDLPSMGVPDGRPGLKFLSDGSGEDFGDADEGRAMGQIAFDVAPGISMCFASSDFGITSFAKYIRRLRTDSSCLADILVDDTMYLDEPMFSDGAIAKAIDDVVTSDKLAGHKVVYFSAAGNNGQGGYASNLRIVPDADARALANSGLTLTGIPSRIDTSGGFHNFNPGSGSPALYQAVTLTGSDLTTFVLQWDDMFDLTPSAISTDLNLLVFDSRGRFLFDISDDNFSTNEPIEIGDIDTGSYRLVIARTGTGTHQASRIRYVAYLPSDGSITGDYINPQQPTIYGHAAARNALAVGAYIFDSGVNPAAFTPALESFSSAGPVTIAFDASGNRLSTPEVRQKPEFSAPDCVNTTFFFNADTNDNFFTFCGTSAAAPHAAAVAALLLQSAGGSGSLSSDRIRAKLQASPLPRDLDPFFSQAVLANAGSNVTVTATGDASNASSSNSSFFRVKFQSSNAAQQLTGMTIDLGPAGLNFDPSTQTGFPFTLGSATNGIVVTSPAPGSRTTLLTLTFTGFGPGGSLSFGIDRDLAATNSGGNSADLLAGAKLTATFSSGAAVTGVFANAVGTGFSANDGFGLINVPAAIKAP